MKEIKEAIKHIHIALIGAGKRQRVHLLKALQSLQTLQKKLGGMKSR